MSSSTSKLGIALSAHVAVQRSDRESSAGWEGEGCSVASTLTRLALLATLSRGAGEGLINARMPLLEITGATKRFGATVAVENVSLSVKAGEFFALLGPSGCGKTTLLRLIAGFERPDAGRIVIDGADVTETPPYARPVNMMFQSYALFPHLDVARNIAFGLKQEGMPRQRRAARVEEMLALVQMAGFAKRRPHELSGGQTQRVALARALAKMPKR